jgi:UDP:flavonoid glycosyltransferase YjiC (YdhE family)
MRKIVLHTFGSLGDLNPFLAMGIELKSRGHEVIIATSDIYKDRVEELGLKFHLVRPLLKEIQDDKDLAALAMDLKRGTEFIIRKILYPNIELMYQDLAQIQTKDAILISHYIGFASPIIAEKLKITWINCILSPNVFMSSHDPSVFPLHPKFIHLTKLGFFVNEIWKKLILVITNFWSKPIYKFRHKIGLSRGENPLFKAWESPILNLALFPEEFAPLQKDWPQNVKFAGFCFYDSKLDLVKKAKLEAFLHLHEEPILVTLGSAAVKSGLKFYQIVLEVLNELNEKAIFLIGNNSLNLEGINQENYLFLDEYPYYNVFPKCKLIVNQGGIGTVANVIRAQKIMLGVPFSHDQPDNCYRMKKLKMGSYLYYSEFTKHAFKMKLVEALSNIHHLQLNQEDFMMEMNGVKIACDQIERVV